MAYTGSSQAFNNAVTELLEKAKNDYVVFGLITYILMQPIVRFLNQDGRIYKGYEAAWKKVIFVYNVALCLFSLGTFIACVFVFRETGFDGLFMYEGTGDHCRHGLYRPETGFSNIAYYFYLSKYAEFADTIFLIVTNKEVIPLHYFHHLFAAFDMWLLHVTQHDSIWIFVFFNSAIHTFMYFYYAASLMGVRFGNLKTALTGLQILQLFFGTILSCLPILKLECHRRDPLITISYFTSLGYTSTLLVMFMHFFITSYCTGPRERAPNARGNARNTVEAEKKSA